MRTLKLIIKREYLTRIKKKSFIILTLLTPALFVLLLAVPLLLSEIKDSDVKRIVVIDSTGKYFQRLQSSEYYSFESVDAPDEGIRAKVGKELFGILQITENLKTNPKSATFLSEKQAPMELIQYVNRVLSETVQQDRLKDLAATGEVDIQVINSVENIIKNSENIAITTLKLDTSGAEKESSTALAAVIGMVFTMLMYMFIMMYGAMVMSGVVEEKSSRIVEVMVSSVRPFDLMMGKIIGIGLTGLTQLFIWVFVVAGIFSLKGIFFPGGDMAGLPVMGDLNMIMSINWLEILVYFLLFFIGGYLIYASIFAMFGAAVDNAQDTQQYMMPVTLIFIFALYAGMYSINNPDGPLAFWCSMIPLTSPIVMMVRIPFEIPLWEKLLSLAILYATILFVVKFAAKIYRVGILMYGKKPSIKEIMKWVTYK